MSKINEHLTAVGHRTRVQNASMQIRLPIEGKRLLEKEAERQGITASTMVRWAIAEYIDAHGMLKGGN